LSSLELRTVHCEYEDIKFRISCQIRYTHLKELVENHLMEVIIGKLFSHGDKIRYKGMKECVIKMALTLTNCQTRQHLTNGNLVTIFTNLEGYNFQKGINTPNM
jgi:hypothetical protein